MTDTEKIPRGVFTAPRGIFFISDSGNVAGVLLHADPETDADRVVRADVDPLHQPRNDHVCLVSALASSKHHQSELINVA